MTIPELLVKQGRWPTPLGPKGMSAVQGLYQYVDLQSMDEGWHKMTFSTWVYVPEGNKPVPLKVGMMQNSTLLGFGNER